MELSSSQMDNAKIFKLKTTDINHLFRHSGLRGNKLSTFTYDAGQGTNEAPSDHFTTFTSSPIFGQITTNLLKPALRIDFNRGGGWNTQEEFHLFLGVDHEMVVAQFLNDEGEFLLVVFDNFNDYLDWWMALYTSEISASYSAVFPDSLDIEVMVSAFHCLDIYHRAYMESMLDYSNSVSLAISTADYIDLLKRSVASNDTRWFLPTLFELVPSLKSVNLSLRPEHLEQIGQLGFIVNKEGLLTLEDRSRIMATELITSLMGSIGVEANALVKGGVYTISQLFLVITAFANHLYSFERDAGGKMSFRHQALNSGELKNAINTWLLALQRALNSSEVDRNAEAVEKVETSDVKTRFCGNCGSQIVAGKKFCTNCGTSI